MALQLYSKEGRLRFEFSPSASDRLSERLMGETTMNLSFVLHEGVEVVVGDYVDFMGRRFVAYEGYRPAMLSTLEYRYQLTLYDAQGILKYAKVLKPASEHQELFFSYDARPHEHIQLIVDNANRLGGSWVVGTVIAGESKNIEYGNKYCIESLADIAEAYNTEWWIEGQTINLSRCEHGSPLSLAYMEGLVSLTATESNTKHYTRLYPLGSSRNIDAAKYGSSRLHLPGTARYVERNTHLGIIEQSEETAFAHIYPRYTGSVSAVRHEERISEGKTFSVYYIKDDKIPFSPIDYEIPGLIKHVVFQSGELNGRDFEANYLPASKEWELITQHPYENLSIPSGLLIPKVGDSYIPYNFRMPDEYIRRAEAELLAEANKVLERISEDTTIYKATTDYVYFLDNALDLKLGRRVSLVDKVLFARSGGTHNSRIIAISRSLRYPTEMEIECSYATERGRIAQIETGIDKMQAAYRSVEATMPTILRSWDSTDPSEDNVFSSARSLSAIQAIALRKDKEDRTAYALGSKEHVPGVVGWLLSPEGDLDLRNLKVSGTLEVDEFRKNRISIQEGEHYFSSGNGVVESVEGDSFVVKGDEGDASSLAVGDYVLGKWATASGQVEVCKLKVTAVSGLKVSYTLAPDTSVRPRVGMHLAQVGHESDTKRQRATLVRGNAIIQYAGLKSWDVLPEHITAVMGDLSGFSLLPFGDLEGSGTYLNNAYITGRIRQLSADGESSQLLPYYKGEWTAETIAHPGDSYLYQGHRWTYQGLVPTDTSPSAGNGWTDEGATAESLKQTIEQRLDTIDVDYLRKAIAKGTTASAGQISTGLVLTEVLGVKDAKGLVTSYMSGESQYPAFAAGVRGFGTERETRMVEIMHDGRVAIGQLRMLGEGGIISFVPRGGDTPYLNIGGVPKELSDMISGQFSGTDRRSQPFSRQTYSDIREEIVLISAFRVAKNGTTVAISGDIAVDTHAYYDRSNPSRESDTTTIKKVYGSDASIHIQLQRRAVNSGGVYSNIVSWSASASSVYQKIWGLEDEIEQSTGEVRQNINERLSGLEAGDYQLIAIIEQSSFNGASSSFRISAFAMTSEQAEREIHLSDQAFYAIFGSRRFFHIDRQAITIQHKLNIKGETDMPGVLASGRVSLSGSMEKAWGAKANRQGYAYPVSERYGNNLYRVYHTVGHDEYSVQITPFDTRDAACIMELTPYYFTCRFGGTTDNKNYAHRFCYAIFGENK